ncbi:MAG: AbgT family transporter, partial [Bacteroidetes Order II. Incertae sedis bacterium]|nr:AbgT family transporter [Bacteroidetes Order II. bacterium]
MDSTHQDASKSNGFIERMLNRIEIVGNKLPDPAMLFLFSLIIVWILSAIMSGMSFADIDPRTGEAIVIKNLLAGDAMATFLSQMVTIFTGFAPLGVVLVAMLGVGVADEAGYFNTSIKM